MTADGLLPNRMRTDVPVAETPVQSFFADVAASFSRAAAAAGTQAHDYRIAGRLFRVTLAGDALRSHVTRAIAHLAVPAEPCADITLYLWDAASTGVVLPPPPWDTDAYSNRGEISGFNDGVRFTTYHADGRVLYLYDSERRFGFVVTFDSALLPIYERAASLRPILSAALATAGIQYTHAAAIGLPEGGVLLAGPSGAGKSTTSLACLDSPLLFAGDDYCAVDVTHGTPAEVYSLYNSAKASAGTIERLPFLKPYIQFWDVGASEKAIYFFYEPLPHKLISHFPLRAILIPRVTGARDTHMEPATARAAMFALAPSTYRQLPGANENVLTRLAALARSVPVFYLDVGTDMPQIPNKILEFLA